MTPGHMSSYRGGDSTWHGALAHDTVTEVNASDGIWVRTAAGSSFGFSEPFGLAVADDRIWVANTLAGSLTELPPG